jgi:uncharacterized protein (DUF1810 family)
MHQLDRFLTAQAHTYEVALAQIRAGRKTSHWIWYIFPQMAGLGQSYYSKFYGIRSIDEAREYLEHDILGTRLREITLALLSHEGLSAYDILGDIDSKKVRSCMTLFDAVSPDDIFNSVLEKYYSGRRCRSTLAMISKP